MIFKDGIESVEESLKVALNGKEKVGTSLNPFGFWESSTDTFNSLIAT